MGFALLRGLKLESPLVRRPGDGSAVASTAVRDSAGSKGLSSNPAYPADPARGTDSIDPATSPDVLPAEIEIVRLFRNGDFAQMYHHLVQCKSQRVNVPARLLTEMALTLRQALPQDTSREELHRSNIEIPLFYAETELRLYSAAPSVASHIQHLHRAFVLYEKEYLQEPQFVENYIWLCYQVNDLLTIQKLFKKYLHSALYDAKTLAHITNAFVYNYDVEFAKSLFSSIIAMGRPLEEAYLSATVVAFTQVRASYDNIMYIFKEWSTADNCESPYPRTIALLLKQSHLYGTTSEVAAMDDITRHLGYNSNFFVQMVRTQIQIINRDNHKIKNITPDDIAAIIRVRNGLCGSRAALEAYYESYLHFFCTYSSMSAVQFVLKEMNKDGIRPTRFTYDNIITHYISTRKFLLLFRFMKKFLSKTVPFEPIYGKYLFDGFIRAYPYHGKRFMHRMDLWLATTLLPDDRRILMKSCRLRKLASSLNPYAIHARDLTSSHKYSSDQWKDIKYDPNKPYLKFQRRAQMAYRTEHGLQEIMRKGICPDYSVIEDTLRNLGPAVRQGILSVLPRLRLNKYTLRLQIYDFILGRPDKAAFVDFVKRLNPQLNTSDRIFLARRALNKCDYDGFTLLLSSLNPLEMTDSRHMIVLNLRLRHAVQTNNFEAFQESIDQFHISDITLSPFLLRQSRFVEKMLLKKLKHAAGDTAELTAALTKLRGLIGDIEVRLEKDDEEIVQLTNEVFEMLREWVQNFISPKASAPAKL